MSSPPNCGCPLVSRRLQGRKLRAARLAAVAAGLAGIALACSRDRLRTFCVGVMAVHLHYLCDLVGSGGPAPDDIWPIAYLAPFSDRWTFQWSGQWPLNAWPNVLLTAGLMACALYRAVRSGYSPVGVFSTAADRAFVETVQRRWRLLRPSG